MIDAGTVRYRWLRLALVIVALAAGCAGQFWLTVQPQLEWSAAAWAVAAIAAILLYLLGRDAGELPALDPGEMPRRVEVALLLAVLAIGVFFVCFRVDEIPAGLNHDAAWEGLYAIRILNGEPYTPYTPEAWGRETLTFYFRAASIWLMGTTIRAVQAPGMLFGVLTLPFFYWWARTMFGVRLALVATLFLAASGWHLVFSRTGWRSDYQPFFMAFTCCLFFRGMQTARPMDFFWSGLGLALTLNIYNGARVFPAVFGLWLVLAALQSWSVRGFVRRYRLGLTFMAVAFLVAIAPLAWFAINHWEIFQGRAMALRGVTTFWEALRASLLLFNHRGNGDDFFVGEPALELPTAVLWVFGLLWCLLRWRDERAQFLLLALAINLVPGLVSKPNLNRDVGTMIFVYAFIGLGAVFFAQQLRRTLAGVGWAASTGFLVLAGVAAMLATYAQYLGPQRRPIWGYYPETTVVGRYLHTIVPDYSIWVGGANYPRDSLTYLSYQGSGEPRPRYVWLDDVRTLRSATLAAEPGKGLAFVLANEGASVDVLSELARRFPAHEIVDLHYPEDGGRVFAKALLVPADGAPMAQRVEAAPEAAAAPPGDLRQPRGIGVLPDGKLAISDFGHHRIQVVTADREPVTQWGSEGESVGQFKEPTGIAVGPEGRIAVADTWNGRVQLFAAGGEPLAQSSERFYGPRGVAFGPEGAIFVADTGNNRIVRLSPALAREAAWGGPGREPGQLRGPVGIAVDERGRVFVADNGNGRMQVFSREGETLAAFAVEGWAEAVYSEPSVAIAGAGRIAVTVPLRQEVRIYDDGGKLLRTFTPPDASPVPFETPLGLAFDASRNELVISDLGGRVVRLRLP